jgi:hypothetical protein
MGLDEKNDVRCHEVKRVGREMILNLFYGCTLTMATVVVSQREVADATDGVVSAAGLCRIELGQRYPTLRSLEALSVALGIRLVVARGRTRVEL